jgi:hypothetical protein
MAIIYTKDLDESMIDSLKTNFNIKAKNKEGFNLTERLDAKKDKAFDQDMINEIVLWKVNRYVNADSNWLEDFHNLKDIRAIDDNNKEHIKEIFKKMINTTGIRLPMASTMLSFRNPKVFQIIDVRTFRVIFGDDDESKKTKNALDANNDGSIDIYLEYLSKLKEYCENKEINFSEADRILYQFDKEYRIMEKAEVNT